VFCRLPFSTTIFIAIVALIALVAGGCARQPATIVERLAVMPLENLSSDPQSSWFSRASSAVVQYDLAGSKNVFAKAVDSLSAAQSMQASRVLEGYFFERNGRTGIRAAVEDFRKTRAVEHIEIEGPVAGGFLPLANELARRLSSGARRFGTNNENAFRFYGEAIGAPDAEASERALKSATDADPGFAVSYLDQARLLDGTGARDRALQAIQAGERVTQLDSIDRADLRYVAAVASGDAYTRIQALETLSHIQPANASLFVDLAAAQFERRDFQAAVRNYQAATLLNPEEPRTWNTLGYALAWTRDLSGARQAIQEYKKLAPEEDTNALDSLGEVSFYLGDFESAAKYFQQAAQKSPPELLKAAEARLMTGDLRDADALVAKYVGPVQGARQSGRQGRTAYRMAQWEFLTGRRMAGMAALETLLPQLDADEQSLALSQLAIWKLETGDRTAAMDLANQAVAHAQAPQAREMSSVSRFVIAGTGAGADAGTGARSGSALVDAYALLFAQKYREALPLLQTAYERTNPSADGQVRVLLAWSRVETGGFAEAGKLLEICPLPLSSGEPMLASLAFPRYFALQAEVLEKQGKMDEAKKNHELFLKYGGGEPTK
jgi:tetratricopeptide (TPR) repeat protein